MPLNSQINLKFGVFVSECCGMEIVIAEGARFPPCPDHPEVATRWKSVTDEPIQDGLRDIKNNDGQAA